MGVYCGKRGHTGMEIVNDAAISDFKRWFEGKTRRKRKAVLKKGEGEERKEPSESEESEGRWG